MSEFLYDFIPRLFLVLVILCLIYIPFFSILKLRGLNRYTELLTIVVPKGTVVKIKGYAILKGYKNESEMIAHLIEKEMEKDRKNINMKDE